MKSPFGSLRGGVSALTTIAVLLAAFTFGANAATPALPPVSATKPTTSPPNITLSAFP